MKVATAGEIHSLACIPASSQMLGAPGPAYSNVVFINSWGSPHLLYGQHVHLSPLVGLADWDYFGEVVGISQGLDELVEDVVRMIVVPVQGVVCSAPL